MFEHKKGMVKYMIKKIHEKDIAEWLQDNNECEFNNLLYHNH